MSAVLNTRTKPGTESTERYRATMRRAYLDLYLCLNRAPCDRDKETVDMPSRDKPPFRADHVGSLLRPPELARARADFKAGEIESEALREREDEAILDVI